MRSTRFFGLSLVFASCLFLALPRTMHGQDDATPEKHGRKYKAPPNTAHIEVTVLKGFNKKPIMNAAVIFHPIKDGAEDGNLEIKTDPDGKATLDLIPIGTQVRIQVLANGFATYAEDFTISEASRQILISMVRPQAQISAYDDNQGKPSEVKPGVQEPVRPKKPTPATPAPSTTVPAKPQQ